MLAVIAASSAVIRAIVPLKGIGVLLALAASLSEPMAKRVGVPSW
jgi:hypothetical protein